MKSLKYSDVTPQSLYLNRRKFVEALGPDQLLHQLLNFNRVGLVLNDLRELNSVNFVAHALYNLSDNLLLLSDKSHKVLRTLILAEVSDLPLVSHHQVLDVALLHF